jgi:hypothetical protein
MAKSSKSAKKPAPKRLETPTDISGNARHPGGRTQSVTSYLHQQKGRSHERPFLFKSTPL